MAEKKSWWDTLFNTDYDVPTSYGETSPRTVTSTSTPNLETFIKGGTLQSQHLPHSSTYLILLDNLTIL